jgi:hypothetical protein
MTEWRPSKWQNDGNDRMVASVGAVPAPPATMQVRCWCGPAGETVGAVFTSANMAPLLVQMTIIASLERPSSAKTLGQSQPHGEASTVGDVPNGKQNKRWLSDP